MEEWLLCMRDWLVLWAPTIWYAGGCFTFWIGSGVLIFRTVMRAAHSSGMQVVATVESATPSHTIRANPGDRTVWTYSKVWVLVTAAACGPFSILFALVYIRLHAND